MRAIWVVAGMRRSGLHAFTDWLMAGLDGPTLLLNNVRLDALHGDKRCVTFSQGHESSTSDSEHIVVIFEDKRLPSVRSAPLLRCLGGPTDQRKHLVVIRDPYNLTASRLRRHRTGRRGMPPRSVASLWPRHAQHGKQWMPCVYNRWFTGEAYRAELAGSLGLPSCPELPTHVAQAGRGSSFDGLKYDGNARQMQVLDRWRAYADDPEYRRLVSDPRLATLSEKLCGFPNPLEDAA